MMKRLGAVRTVLSCDRPSKIEVRSMEHVDLKLTTLSGISL
jgi:hypothetical protein